MDIINFLKQIFVLPEVNNFISTSATIVKKGDKYKSWLGFNYLENRLDSVKLYFAFYNELEFDFISTLFDAKQAQLFFRDYDKRNEKAIISSYEFGSGYAIGLKIDLDFNITKAFGYNLMLDREDELFLKNNNLELIDVMPHKGVYHHFMRNQVYEKKYYYLINQAIIKNKIKEINFNEICEVPVLEVGFGKGFYKNSNILDEKYIFLGNYQQVFNDFITNKNAFSELKADFYRLEKQIGIEGFCPGIYQNNKVQSYYLGYKENNKIHYDTLEKLLEKIPKLNY